LKAEQSALAEERSSPDSRLRRLQRREVMSAGFLRGCKTTPKKPPLPRLLRLLQMHQPLKRKLRPALKQKPQRARM
jgi:hypothetical protein